MTGWWWLGVLFRKVTQHGLREAAQASEAGQKQCLPERPGSALLAAVRVQLGPSPWQALTHLCSPQASEGYHLRAGVAPVPSPSSMPRGEEGIQEREKKASVSFFPL